MKNSFAIFVHVFLLKSTFLIVSLFFSCCIYGQTAFRHVTNTGNINANTTRVDHPQINGNPDAFLFILPNYNLNGSATNGVDYQQNAGVFYDGKFWYIFNENPNLAMQENVTFNVLVASPNDKNCFKITATTAAIDINGAPNGFVIDHPVTNGKRDALVLITQNRDQTYNDASQVTSYVNGKWRIANNGYLAYRRGETSDNRCLMPAGARFNVMVLEQEASVMGISESMAFQHTAKNNNIVEAAPQHITFLEPLNLIGNEEIILFATAYWGHGETDVMGDNQSSGPYNESPLIAWFDHPNDPWNNRNHYWSLYNANSKPMPVGAKFHVVAVGKGAKAMPKAPQIYDLDGSSGIILHLDKNVYANGEVLKARLEVKPQLRTHLNKYVVYASSGTKDVETVELDATDPGNLLSRKNVPIRIGNSSKTNDGILSVTPGETIIAYYFVDKTEKQNPDTALTFIADYALIESKVSNAEVEVNSKLALSANEKNEKGEIITGTLLAKGGIPVEIAAGEVLFFAPEPNDLKRFLTYSKGTLLNTLPMQRGQMHLVSVKTNEINLKYLSQMRDLWGMRDTLMGSNETVLKLVQFCMQAQMDGFSVSPNPRVNAMEDSEDCACLNEENNPVPGQGLKEETLPASYSANPDGSFLAPIPYIWNYMAIWDKDVERVNVGVVDYGFHLNKDYDHEGYNFPQCKVYTDLLNGGSSLTCAPGAALGRPTVRGNGTDTPSWHGNAVWSRIGAVLNNGMIEKRAGSTEKIESVAGVAGQVARPVIVNIVGMETYVFGLATAIRAAVDNGAQVINVSGGHPCKIMTNILGWAPNICSGGGRLEVCAAVGPAIFATASLACEIGFRWWAPPLADACQTAVAVSITGFIGTCVAQFALGDRDNILNDAVQYAKSKGVPVVASAGNFMTKEQLERIIPSAVLDFVDLAQHKMTVENWHFIPADLPDVICVGAARNAKPFENMNLFGNRVDIWAMQDGHYVAPDVITDEPPGGYTLKRYEGEEEFGGTSSSAPFITGLLTNAMAVNPRLNPANLHLSADQRSQIPNILRDLLKSTAFTVEQLDEDPLKRRRNLVNPIRFIREVARYENASGIPNDARYIPFYSSGIGTTPGYNLDTREPANDSESTIPLPEIASRFDAVVLKGAIVYIPGKAGQPPLVDVDYFKITVPETPTEALPYSMVLLLRTPLSDRYGNLVLSGEGLVLVSTAREGTDEIKTYRISNIASTEVVIKIEGATATDDNLYELTIEKLIPSIDIGSLCKGADAELGEGIYSIRLYANNKAITANGVTAKLQDYRGRMDQLWYIVPFGERGKRYYRILTVGNDNLHLGGIGPDVCVGEKNGDIAYLGGSYYWRIETAPNGTYFLRSLCGAYQLLEGVEGNGSDLVFQECSDKSTNKWRLTKVRNVSIGFSNYVDIPAFCPVSDRSGDTEFGGNDIKIVLTVASRIVDDGRKIEVDYTFSAEEMGGDYSKVGHKGTITAYEAPADKRILSIFHRGFDRQEFVLSGGSHDFDCDGDTHKIPLYGGTINYIELVGDTGGGDISDDANCHCDMRVHRIQIDNIFLKLTSR